MTQLYHSPHLIVLLLTNGEQSALEINWRSQVSGQELQKASIQALMLARRHRVTAWISNDLALGPLNEADAQWAQTMLHSLRNDLGVTRFALLESSHARNRELLQPHVLRYSAPDSDLQLRRFSSVLQARAWALSPA